MAETNSWNQLRVGHFVETGSRLQLQLFQSLTNPFKPWQWEKQVFRYYINFIFNTNVVSTTKGTFWGVDSIKSTKFFEKLLQATFIATTKPILLVFNFFLFARYIFEFFVFHFFRWRKKHIYMIWMLPKPGGMHLRKVRKLSTM
jgi:hypothetical protein